MCDYKLKMQYVLNSRSYNNRQTVKSYQEIFHTIIIIRIFIVNISLKCSVNKFSPCMNEYFCTSPAHAPITFLTVRGRVLSQTLTIRRLCCHFSHSYIKTFSECWSTLIVMIYDIYIRQPKSHFCDLRPVQKSIFESFKSFLVINYC